MADLLLALWNRCYIQLQHTMLPQPFPVICILLLQIHRRDSSCHHQPSLHVSWTLSTSVALSISYLLFSKPPPHEIKIPFTFSLSTHLNLLHALCMPCAATALPLFLKPSWLSVRLWWLAGASESFLASLLTCCPWFRTQLCLTFCDCD